MHTRDVGLMCSLGALKLIHIIVTDLLIEHILKGQQKVNITTVMSKINSFYSLIRFKFIK